MRAADSGRPELRFWLSILACAGACVACAGASGGQEKPAAPASATAATSPAAALTCDSAAPVAIEDARAVVAKRCTSCHSPTGMAGEDYDWTNERSLVAHRRNVAAQIAGDSMPPAGYPRPTPEERRTLLCWAKGQS